jgi:hypothetical protein
MIVMLLVIFQLDGRETEHTSEWIGCLLILVYLGCDSFTSQWQAKVYQTYPRVDEPQMMLGSNVCSVVLSAVAILLEGIPFQSIAEKCKDLAVVGRLFLMGLCQATGQVFVQKTIKNHGPILFTLAMTSRQVNSVILSFFIYGHRVTRRRIGCVFAVFYMALYRVFKEKPGILSCTARLLTVLAGLVAYSTTAFLLISRDDTYSEGSLSGVGNNRNATLSLFGSRLGGSSAVHKMLHSKFLPR